MSAVPGAASLKERHPVPHNYSMVLKYRTIRRIDDIASSNYGPFVVNTQEEIESVPGCALSVPVEIISWRGSRDEACIKRDETMRSISSDNVILRV